MPANNQEDPQSYVKLAPLPFPSHVGVAIQARNETIYNATIPTRDEVRRDNYKRRSAQMSEQGFRSVNYKPYKAIGDPIYLEPKKLILHALGQWNGSSVSELSSEVQLSDDENQQDTSREKKKIFQTSKADRESDELHKELLHGRELIRCVALGQGLFDLIQKENDEKIANEKKEAKAREEMLRRTMRPPRMDSSSEDDDSENETDLRLDQELNSHLANDDDLYIASHSNIRPFSSGVLDRHSVAFKLSASEAVNQNIKRSKTRLSANSKSQLLDQRPYTPQHSNIAVKNNNQADSEALFRQLCVLHWLLESMSNDPPKITRPVTVCWTSSFKDLLENEKDVTKKSMTDKIKRDRVESDWNKFAASPQNPKVNAKKYARSRFNSKYLPGRVTEVGHLNDHSSLSSSCEVQSLAEDTLQDDGEHITTLVEIMENEESSAREVPEINRGKCFSPALKNREVSISPPLVNQDVMGLPCESAASEASFLSGQMRNRLSVQSSKAADQAKANMDAKELERLSLTARILNELSQNEGEYRLYRPPKEAKERLRADANVRPKSSAEVVQFLSSASSSRLKSLPQKMKAEFTDVFKEQKLMVKYRVEAIERNRLKKLERKFALLPTDTSVHKALKAMRLKEQSENKNVDEQPDIYHHWYLDLSKLVAEESKTKWYYQKIIDKLSKYGLVEAGKQNSFKFVKVLAGLREWEICSPDVCAAIEFCREKVIEMEIEDYEEWFHEAFPSISRPEVATKLEKPTSSGFWSSPTKSKANARSNSSPIGTKQVRIQT